MSVSVIGLDIAKQVFQVHAVDGQGHKVVNRKLRRSQVLQWFAKLDRHEDCLVGLEACGTSHYWARELTRLGYRVGVMKTSYVKPFRQGHKTDARDAEAISEAVQRPNMAFVPIKSEDQQAILALHRIRERRIAQRTQLVNQTRSLLLEQGVAIAQGRKQFIRALPGILEDAENGLPMLLRQELAEIYQEYQVLQAHIERCTAKLERLARQSEPCRRLMSIDGVGPLSALLLMAVMGDGKAFRNGRQFAAYLGLTPRQHSSGGKDRLLGISKAGHRDLRKCLIHGARAVESIAARKDGRRYEWLRALGERRHRNVAVVALAAKNARIAYALLSQGTFYQDEPAQAA